MTDKDLESIFFISLFLFVSEMSQLCMMVVYLLSKNSDVVSQVLVFRLSLLIAEDMSTTTMDLLNEIVHRVCRF